MPSRFLRTLLPLAAVLSIPATSYAQVNASMTGVVTDASGAVIPDVQVTLSNPATGSSFKAVTDSRGTYRFPNVPPGPGYKVLFERAGFNGQTIVDVYVNVANVRTQNVQLSAGTNVEVQVSAKEHAVTINTTDATIGNNFQVQQVNDLPIQDRGSLQVLFVNQPGVSPSGTVTGARQDQNEVTLDGMDINDIASGQTTGTFPTTGGAPVDAVQEFRAVVSGQTSIVGTGAGGQYQLVSKSGTNSFHGNINEYHRDVSTVANTWFNNNLATPLPRPKLIRNQFGGNIGGAILKDKLFFFGDINVGRIVQQSTQTATVPLDSFRAGTIGYTNNGAGCTSSSRRNTQPACISEYTPAQTAAVDPQGIGNNAALFAYINQRYPRANDLTQGDGVNTGLYRFLQATPNNTYNYLADVDYNLTPRQQIKLQYHAIRTDAVQALNRFDTDPLTFPNQNRSYGYVGTHTWQIGNNKVNQFYYGSTVSVLNFPVNYFALGTSSFTFGPLTSPNPGLNAQRRRVPIPEFRDDFNWTVGHHTLQFGGLFKFIKTNSLNRNDYNFVTAGLGGLTTSLATGGVRPANLLTNNTTTTNRFDVAYAFALGRVASVSRNYNYDASGTALPIGTGAIRRYRYYQTEAYVGDTWKATPSLTLSYGLRYQYYSVPYEVNGVQSNPSISFNDYVTARIGQAANGTSGNTAVPLITYNLGGKANNAGGLYNPDSLNLAPRFSFAYAPAALPKTVINGAFNVIYDRTVVNAVNFVQDQLSYLFQNSQAQSFGAANARTALATDPRLGANLSYPAPPVGVALTKPYTPYVSATGVPNGINNGQVNYAVDKNLKNPYQYLFNVGMQRELRGGFVVQASYVGRLAHRLIGQADASQLLDFRDSTSGQGMAAAFAALTSAVRQSNPTTTAGYNALPRQPWFENQVSTASTYASKTAYVAATLGQTVTVGDFADTIQQLQANNLIGRNVGLPAQFAANTFITNRGYSNYNGALLTVSKNSTNGLTFQFNYTYSHSMDNVSAVANTIGINSGTGQICDVTSRQSCYGNSDFDVKHVITSNFVYELPFGRGRRFGGNTNRFLDLAVGGWQISGIPGWRSGIAFNSATGAYLAGYSNNTAGIFTGDRSALKINVHKDSAGRLQLFDDPARAAAAFRNPIGFEYGSRNNLRGPGALTFDAGLSKRFHITEQLAFQFRADAFNVLNHPVFANPTFSTSSNINNSGTFGQLTAVAASGARVAQFSGRLEF